MQRNKKTFVFNSPLFEIYYEFIRIDSAAQQYQNSAFNILKNITNPN